MTDNRCKLLQVVQTCVYGCGTDPLFDPREVVDRANIEAMRCAYASDSMDWFIKRVRGLAQSDELRLNAIEWVNIGLAMIVDIWRVPDAPDMHLYEAAYDPSIKAVLDVMPQVAMAWLKRDQQPGSVVDTSVYMALINAIGKYSKSSPGSLWVMQMADGIFQAAEDFTSSAMPSQPHLGQLHSFLLRSCVPLLMPRAPLQ